LHQQHTKSLDEMMKLYGQATDIMKKLDKFLSKKKS